MRTTNQSPLVAGIDIGGRQLAVSIFAVHLKVGKLELMDKHLAKVPQRNRAWELYNCVEDLHLVPIWPAVSYFFIEEPLVGRGVRSSLQLAQMAGALIYSLGQRNLGAFTELVPVSRWKGRTVGKGNASKEDVKDWLKSTHPGYAAACGDSQDLIDATCIALYGAEIVAQSRSLTLQGTAAEPDVRATRGNS